MVNNELQIFENTEFGMVRTLEENGKILFCGSDVAKALGYSNTRDAVRRHCKGVVKRDGVSCTVNQHGIASNQISSMSFISESDLYRLITHSKLPEAEKFERWVFEEVLPSIRKHGAYMTPAKLEEVILNPDVMIQLCQSLKEEQEKRSLLQKENEAQKQIIGELQPKANYVDQILNNKGLVTITQIAKDYGMSGRALNAKLHELGIQYKQSGQWLLYKEYHNEGYTHSKTIDITRSDGTPDVRMETKWTQKGRLFLYELLKGKDILPVIEQSQKKTA